MVEGSILAERNSLYDPLAVAVACRRSRMYAPVEIISIMSNKMFMSGVELLRGLGKISARLKTKRSFINCLSLSAVVRLTIRDLGPVGSLKSIARRNDLSGPTASCSTKTLRITISSLNHKSSHFRSRRALRIKVQSASRGMLACRPVI